MDRPCRTLLRPARRQDAGVLAAMSRELIETGLGWRYTPARIAALIDDAETMVLVAGEAADIHGFAAMHFGDTQAHLALLCVQPARQRQGTGRGLMAWLTESARVAGMASIRLELRADNAAALAFYRRLGFVEQQWIDGYYDGLVAARRMRLMLARVDS